MDQKSWLWKKKSAEKSLAADKELQTEKEELEGDIRELNDKLSSALSECNSKDAIAKNQVKIAQEAIAGWEKAEAESASLRKDLDKVLQQKAASEERISQLDAALKDCIQQLGFIREDQERRVQSAVIKTVEEFEKTRISLDGKLAEAGKKLVKLDAENTMLNKVLSGKEKLIEELSKYRAQVEADFNDLLLRVESTDKENASLKYEVRVLEKELDIRNEETEFNRRAADAAQKQHKESAKKIAKLESECQRLRVLVRKRLPGPAALAMMKNEVEMLGRDEVETRRRKSNYSLISSSMDFRVDVAADTPSKRFNLLTEQLYAVEEENRSLRCALNRKSSELHFSRTMYARVASRLSQGDGQVEDSLGKLPFFLQEHSLATLCDIGSDDKASCAESWASALISELEHFKSEKQSGTPSQRNMETPDMYLMDDFAEMEKLAVVSVDYPAGSSHPSSEEGNVIVGPSGSPCGRHSSGRGMVPVHHYTSAPLVSQSEKAATSRVLGQLDDLMKMFLEHCQASQRNPNQVLEDIKVALVYNGSNTSVSNVLQTSPNKFLKSDDPGNENNMSTIKKGCQKLQANLSMSIHKILEIIEGLSTQSFPGKYDKTNPTGYVVRVFQWKISELSPVLQQTVQACKDLLSGSADLEQFVQLVASSLEWIMTHCFSVQDVPIMKEAIRSHLDWDESRSLIEADSGSANHSALQPNTKGEITILNIEQANEESSIPDLDDRFQSKIVKGESFKISFQDSKQVTEDLQSETENMRETDANTGDQVENQKMVKRDLETQFTAETSLEQGTAYQQISPMESDLEIIKSSCNDLNVQLKSMPSKDVLDDGKNSEKTLQNVWEITAASEKLAECQETILNLGKKLKAMASPRDAVLFDKVISTPAPADHGVSRMPTVSQRLSLRDKMLAEDDDQISASPRTKDDIFPDGNSSSAVSPRTKDDILPDGQSNSVVSTDAATELGSKFTGPNGIGHDAVRNAAASMAIVPLKKNGGTSFWKRLFWRHKKGGSKKPPFSSAATEVIMNKSHK